MAATQATSPAVQLPPELAGVQGDPLLINYLRGFSLWAKNSFAGKLDKRTALPGILLQASDPPAGTTPKVYILQVNTAGALTVTPVPIASGTSPP